GASRSSLRSPVSQRVSASLPPEAESGGQGGSGAQIGGTTVLDAAYPAAVSSRRSHREQPAGAPGRRELDRRNLGSITKQGNRINLGRVLGREDWGETDAQRHTIKR